MVAYKDVLKRLVMYRKSMCDADRYCRKVWAYAGAIFLY